MLELALMFSVGIALVVVVAVCTRRLIAGMQAKGEKETVIGGTVMGITMVSLFAIPILSWGVSALILRGPTLAP